MNKNIKLDNGSTIKNLTFEESFNGKFTCFSGQYNDIYFTGSNENKVFKIMNYKDFGWNQILVCKIEMIIEQEYYKLKNKKTRQKNII